MIEKIRVKQNYTVVPNAILRDPNLSLRAKGLYAYLCSKPGTWRFSMSRVEGSDGRAAIRSAMQELLQAGYVRRELIFNSKHQIIGYLYVVSGNPSSENPSSENRTTEIDLNPLADNEEPERYKKRIIKEGNNKKRDINNKIKNKNILSSDINFSKLEKGVISELKDALAVSDIPKEIEELLLTEMLRAGFPRKSLRSRIDRENLHILWEHYGSWETVIKAFQNLQKLQKEGRFLEWNWSKILRNADYLATYEPEPYFPVDRIDDLEGLRRYFAKVRPPKKYVARFIYRWVEHWKFVDMPPERTKRLIEEILKYYYSDSQEAGVDSQKIQEERSKIVSMMQKSQRVY